tara:strand:- start:73 stop:861 length:789 start_codon:yes stop_codon:yes gene_type:complete
MSKNIIYSVWSDLTEEHMSVNDYKKESFKKYKDKLIKLQKEYAVQCNADYELFNPISTDYANVQFDKIFKLEELTKYYDKVVYFDLDIIPITKKNIFDSFDFNNICVYDYTIQINNRKTIEDISRYIKRKEYIPQMNRYSKVCAKNAMLLIDNVVGNENIVNTGVVCGNKKAVESLKFSERMNDMNKTLQIAKEDNLYPEEMSKPWIKNNEVYFSYLLERYKIKFNNIGIQWNYILDDLVHEITDAAHLIHQVNKDFHVSIK